MHRAFSTLEIKDFDDDDRTIEGIATTPEPDRMDDIVVPEGAKFALPLPFLMGHDSGKPIGHVTRAKVTDDGIEIAAQLAKVEEPGTLKERLDEAWQSIKVGLVRGLSIGFRSLKHVRIDGTYGYEFTEWEWLELSAVVIPANAGASILTAKDCSVVRVTQEHFRKLKQRNGAVYLDSPR